MLRHVADAARELLGARYAALGVLAPSGGLEEFVHVGMDDETVSRIDHLPEGKGLLGALINDPHPIRLNQIAADKRSSGFPDRHPPMESFLGVPIRIRDEVFGNLYLTDSVHGRFSAEDEELARALAATAAVAIDNARHFESTRRQSEWLAATATVTRQMLGPRSGDLLGPIAAHARRITDADLVAVLLPGDGSRDVLRVEVAHGEPGTVGRLTGRLTPVDTSLCAHVFVSAEPIRLGSPGERPDLPPSLIATAIEAGPLLVVPLTGSTRTNGVLAVVRRAGRPRFVADDLEMIAGFANQASVALELAGARAEQERAGMLEERQRIAEDLHDHVIQRLFAAGLTLHGLAARVGPDPVGNQLLDVVTSLDDTISQIRTSIFALQRAPETGPASLRAQALDLVADAAKSLGFSPDLRFSGPIDTRALDASVAEDLRAVLREALSNIARHARASRVQVELSLGDGELVLQVRDDGVGLGPTTRRSGLGNLRSRAERHGGTMQLAPANPIGTCLRWAVPVP